MANVFKLMGPKVIMFRGALVCKVLCAPVRTYPSVMARCGVRRRYRASLLRLKQQKTDSVSAQPSAVKRLAAIFPGYEDEFPLIQQNQKVQQFKRIYKIGSGQIFTPRTALLLGASTMTVFGIGFVEGALQCKQVPILEAYEAIQFSACYSTWQIIPSVVWDTQDPLLVAKSMGIDAPSTILKQLNPAQCAGDATLLMTVKILASSRAIVASFMMLGQILNVANQMFRAADVYRERVETGKEPPFPGVDERVFRFCGENSDTTTLALSRYGQHIFPIFENPERIPYTVAKYSDNGRVPTFWHVQRNYYGYRQSWKSFPIDEECFLASSTGRRVLYFEADATNSDDPLGLDEDRVDLTLENASQGQQMVEALYKANKVAVPLHRCFRVFLGNMSVKTNTGLGETLTLRKRIEKSHEMDVVIDSRAAIFNPILRWCEQTVGEKRDLILHTNDENYFRTMKMWLRGYGYNVLDVSEVKHVSDDSDECATDPDATPTKTPAIIYFKTTSETVNCVYALARAGEISGATTCVLINKIEGAKALQALPSSFSRYIDKSVQAIVEDGLHVVCSAIVFDDLYRQVRLWVRMGHTAVEIQGEIDERFRDVLDTLVYQQLEEIE